MPDDEDSPSEVSPDPVTSPFTDIPSTWPPAPDWVIQPTWSSTVISSAQTQAVHRIRPKLAHWTPEIAKLYEMAEAGYERTLLDTLRQRAGWIWSHYGCGFVEGQDEDLDRTQTNDVVDGQLCGGCGRAWEVLYHRGEASRVEAWIIQAGLEEYNDEAQQAMEDEPF